MLERDVNNLRGTLGRFAPELLETEYAREIWALFEAGRAAGGEHAHGCVCARRGRHGYDDVMDVIEDAREENIRRELGRVG